MSEFLDYINILPAIIAVAAMITALTPTPKDDAVLAKVRKVLDVIGMNFGNAKNR